MWAPPEGAAERYAAAVFDTFSGMVEERRFAAARRAGLISLLVVDMIAVVCSFGWCDNKITNTRDCVDRIFRHPSWRTHAPQRFRHFSY